MIWLEDVRAGPLSAFGGSHDTDGAAGWKGYATVLKRKSGPSHVHSIDF